MRKASDNHLDESYVTKLVLRIVIRGRTLDEIALVQYGFMPDKETSCAVFVLWS